MYPELYPELDGRSRKLKGFALLLSGSFVFMVSTIATIMLSAQWLYLGFAGLSLLVVSLIFLAHRSHLLLGQVGLLIAASATLATEVAAIAVFFPVPLAAACASLTLAGTLVTARGIHDIEAVATLEPFAAKRRKEMTIEQQAGGE